ncbi:MAG: threonine/serine exporter family protein [Candidatus Saccharimonadales bacterium]
MKLFNNIGSFLREITDPDETPDELLAERYGETITPNMRALRLAMTVADYLLSMGVPVSDVVGTALDITGRYCKRKVSIDISSTVMMFSQYRGNDREPLTLIRTSVARSVNSSTIQSLEEISHDIHAGKLSLEQAEKQLEDVLDNPKQRPLWLVTVGNGAISAGVGALLSGSLLIIAATFIVGGFISYVLVKLAARQMPTFFVQVVAATISTIVAATLTWLGNHGVSQLAGLNPNLIIIGGIVMLVSGLAIVGAVEDAIDEYYVTAMARILRIVMMTAGIIVGIALGLFVAKHIGVHMVVNTNAPLLNTLSWQYVGAIMIAAGYALSVHARLKGIILAGLIGAASWGVFVLASANFSSVVSSFIAATVVGGVATLLSRLLRTPSTIMITAGIIPLVPGLTLFNGLMVLIIGNTDTNIQVGSGSSLLLTALLIALAIAAGATLGNLIARPIRRTLVRAQNALPRRNLRG